MTVSTTTSKVSYTGNGSTDTFAYGFKIYADGDLKVYVDGTLKTLTTHYTVTNAGVSSGGNVVFTSGNIPASGDKVVIERNLARTQSNDWNDYDRFPAETLEDSVDRLTFITQEIDEEASRSIKFATTVTDVGTVEVTGTATERANKVFGFDDAGNLITTIEIGNFKGDWAASTSYVARDLVKDTSTNNIFICTTSHTSSGAEPLTTNTDSAKWSLIVDAESASTSATNAAASATAAASSATASAASATTSENWSTKTDAAVSGSDYSAKEYAQGTQASTGGSAKSWSQDADAVNGAGANDRSAKQWAQGSLTGATLGGSAKDWAQTAEDSQVDGSEYSAKHYSAKASASATAAASSATSAATAQTAAETAQAAAEAAADNFEDTYLGAHSSDPATDGDGDALTAGDLYFNTTTDRMRVYSGSSWSDVALDSATVVAKTSATGSGQLPSGTTAQRDSSPSAGMIRYNSTTASFEGYGAAWGAIGGADPTQVLTNKISPSSGTSFTFGDLGDTFTVPSGATLDIASGGEIDIASGATLDVNGTIDATGATITGFPEGGLKLITSATNNSSVANWDFTDCFSATYRVYLVNVAALAVASAQEVRLKIGVSNLSTVEDFAFVMWQTDAAGSTTYRASTSANYIDLNNTGGAGEPISGYFYIFNPYSSAEATQVLGKSMYYRTSGGTYSMGDIGAMATSSSSSASLQFVCSSGNIGSSSYTARVSIYGLAES